MSKMPVDHKQHTNPILLMFKEGLNNLESGRATMEEARDTLEDFLNETNPDEVPEEIRNLADPASLEELEDWNNEFSDALDKARDKS